MPLPFASCFKVFKKEAEELAEEYGGSGLLTALTSKQEGGLNNLLSLIGGSSGGLQERASSKGMDPNLISGLMSMVGGGSGGSGGGGGIGISTLMDAAKTLTKGGSSGSGGGVGGFLGLLGGLSGGSGSSNNVLNILIGLGKSYIDIQRNNNPSASDWAAANPEASKTSSSSLSKWAMKLVTDLLFPDKKAKEVLDGGQADVDKDDKPTDKDGLKGWYDGHPEIGKMQKDVFDDVFDITDDDDDDAAQADDAPLIPTPVGFSDDCSILDEAMVLFLNTNLLLELRKQWRFLYSTKTSDGDFGTFSSAVECKGPTLLVIRTSEGQIVGAFASTSLFDTEGGWVGNGDTFVFSLHPKMAVFYSTGKDDNFVSMDRSAGLGFGGRQGKFGLAIDGSMTSGEYHEDAETFDLPATALQNGRFDVDHIEAWGLGTEPNPDDERSNTEIRKPNVQVSGGQVDMNDLLSQIS